MDLFNNIIVGGPPSPMYKNCNMNNKNTTDDINNLELLNVNMDVKKMAYDVYVKNTGYTLYDLTKITELNNKNAVIIINNTSFFVFISIFIVLALLLIILMTTNILNIVVGLHLLLLLSIIIYTLSVTYRLSTLSSITSSTSNINSDIKRNKALYEQSIALLPNSIKNIDKVVGN